MIRNYAEQISILSKSQAVRSISLLLSSNFLVAGLGFVTSVLVLRRLDTNSIGLLYPLIGLMMVIDQFSDLGLTTSYVKVASTHQKADPKKADRVSNVVFKAKVLLAVVVPAIGMLFATKISQWLFHSDAQTNWVRIMLAISSLSVLASFYQANMQIEGKFRALSFVKILPNLAKVGILLILAWRETFYFIPVFIAFALVPIGHLLLGVALSNRRYLQAKSKFANDFSEVYHLSKWVLLSSITVALIGQADVFLVTSMAGADELARYMGGHRLAAILPVFTTALVTVLLPKVSSYTSKAELNYYFRKSLLITPPIALGVALVTPLAGEIIPLILGTKYASSTPVFQLLCIQFALGVVVTPMSLILYSLNKAHVFAVMNLVQLLLLVFISYLLIPIYGAVGSAIGGLVIRVVGTGIVLFVCFREGVMTRQ